MAAHPRECVGFGALDVHLEEVDSVEAELVEKRIERTSGNALAGRGIEDRARCVELAVRHTDLAVARVHGAGQHADVREPTETHGLFETAEDPRVGLDRNHSSRGRY